CARGWPHYAMDFW
nr:immunoglobulin heavy chain junction region [Mus musculus]MBK4186443.1 immunoglobulin heavy chain junction region [Mus musculus]